MRKLRFCFGLKHESMLRSKSFMDNDSGQMILMTCVLIALALVLITIYGYSSLGTGEGSINRENMNAYYYYDSIRYRYEQIYESPDVGTFEKEIEGFALLHGYSVEFSCKGNNSKITFVDKDIRIEEELEGGLCH